MNKTILVVGDAMLDRYLYGRADRISPEAPVPIIYIEDKTFSMGGAANVAANIVGLGTEAILIGACGKDKHASTLRLLLRDLGITDYLIEEGDRPTTLKTRVIAKSQQLFRIDDESTSPLYYKGKKKVMNKIENVIDSCSAVIISDYNKGMITEEISSYIIDTAEIPVFVDPKGTDWTKYCNAFCITPNIKEFEAYTEMSLHETVTSETKLKELARYTTHRLGLELLIITRGADGMLVVPSKGNIVDVPVETISEVIDVSGAGDTVVSALAVSMVLGKDLKESAEFANLAAGLVVGRLGTSAIQKGEM